MHRNDINGMLTSNIEGDELVIRVGLDVLIDGLFNEEYGSIENIKLLNPRGFVQDMIYEMLDEDEVGNTPLIQFIEKMANNAIDNGSPHIDEIT